MGISHDSEFASALPYERYLQTGTSEQQRRWTQVHEISRLTAAQERLIGGFVREMRILVYTGIWCGDCVQQCPLLYRIAQANPAKIDLRFRERAQDAELPEDLRINGGSRVPVVLLFSEDGKWCATAGDRTLQRYRALALSRLGRIARRESLLLSRAKLMRRSAIGWMKSNGCN